MSDYGGRLEPQHAEMLAASGITPEHARARGYVSVDTKARLEQIGVTKAGRNVPGLLVPLRRVDESTWGYQYRPDQPRANAAGKPIKYETPRGQRNGLDVPPGVGPKLGDPSIPLFVTEGARKADAGALAGLCVVDLPGVWSWIGTNPAGGKIALPDWHDIALNGRRVVLAFDSDASRKRSVRKALTVLAGYLASKGAAVTYLHLPDAESDKCGLDDYLAAGHTVDELWRLVRPDPPELVDPGPVDTEISTEKNTEISTAEPVAPATLGEVHDRFTRWLGAEYDLAVLDAVLCAAAAEKLTGDPAWILVVSGSGAAKTETVGALAGAGAHITSTITSEGALLSATSLRERAKDATGGLLRKVGSAGLLVVKDFTSILSMSRDPRGAVLAALREVYDGRWERNVGSDGGRTLTWTGRVVVVGAVTTAWDSAHSVVAAMGDRFVLIRLDSTSGRQASGRQAIRNAGAETTMRAELSTVVAGLLSTVDPGHIGEVDDDAAELLLGLADVVTLARTAVTRDYRGDVIDCHAPEMPTRFAKQLTMLVRGGLAVGMTGPHALAVATRCAADSVPPLRLAILLDLAEHPASTTHAVRKRLDKPRATVDRELQALHMLGLLACDEIDDPTRGKTSWHYSIAETIDADALSRLGSARNVTTRTQAHKEEVGRDSAADDGPHGGTDIPGTTPGRSLSHPAERATCRLCSKPLASLLAANGYDAHPSCLEAAS